MIKKLAIFIPQKNFDWHNEDSWAVSSKFPIYAIADGVTLPIYEKLTMPSGPRIVADLFCNKAIEFIEQNFDNLSNDLIKSAYKYANEAIGQFNKQEEKTFSTVASLVAIKNREIFGSRITDCGFALLRKGEIIFKTPEFWSWLKSKNKSGYGLINGTMKISEYLDFYSLKFEPGDVLVLFTDGFENHFGVKEFIRLFSMPDLTKLENAIRHVDRGLIQKDNERYGHERTLLICPLR